MYCRERVAEYHRLEWLRGGPRTSNISSFMESAADEEEEEEERMWLGLFPTSLGGLHAVRLLLDGHASRYQLDYIHAHTTHIKQGKQQQQQRQL